MIVIKVYDSEFVFIGEGHQVSYINSCIYFNLYVISTRNIKNQ